MLKNTLAVVAVFSFLPSAFSEEAAPALETESRKISYSLGHTIGSQIKSAGVDGIESDALFAGIKAALAGTAPALSEEELEASMLSFQQQAQAAHNRVQEAAKAENAKAGEAFLEENGKRDGVTTTASGLQYEVIKEGTGAKPKSSDTVQVHYHGTLVDGTVFDSSVERGQPARFGVGQVIAGWTEALQLMPAGSKWKLFIPSKLAYGENGAGERIQPNSTLIFEVELLEIAGE